MNRPNIKFKIIKKSYESTTAGTPIDVCLVSDIDESLTGLIGISVLHCAGYTSHDYGVVRHNSNLDIFFEPKITQNSVSLWVSVFYTT